MTVKSVDVRVRFFFSVNDNQKIEKQDVSGFLRTLAQKSTLMDTILPSGARVLAYWTLEITAMEDLRRRITMDSFVKDTSQNEVEKSSVTILQPWDDNADDVTPSPWELPARKKNGKDSE